MGDRATKFSKPLCFSKKIEHGKTTFALNADKYSIKLYVRQQGNTVFNFYAKNERLIGEVVRDGNTQRLSIGNIPPEFQVELNEEKIAKIRRILDQCYFSVQGSKIIVNARGLGGWNTDVHMDRTYQWTLTIINDQNIALTIAQACKSVDEGETNPDPRINSKATTPEVQRWHFNINSTSHPEYSSGDSRITLAVNCMAQAIRMYHIEKLRERKQYLESLGVTRTERVGDYTVNLCDALGQLSEECREYQNILIKLRRLQQFDKQREYPMNEILSCLGRGLHPLQDMFAHTRSFVGTVPLTEIQYHWPEYLGGGADNVGVQPERAWYTEIATKLYLAVFVYNTRPDLLSNERVQYICSDMNGSPNIFQGLLYALQSKRIELPIVTCGNIYQLVNAVVKKEGGSRCCIQ